MDMQNSRTPQRRQPVRKKKKRRDAFRRNYLIFVAVLVCLMAVTLIYVHSALKDYERSQPEHFLLEEIEKLRTAAKKGNFEEVLSLDMMRNQYGATEEEIQQFKTDFLASEITFKEDHTSVDADRKLFDVLSDGCKVATFTLGHVSQETKLLIFTLDRWRVEDFQVTGYAVDLTAPGSVIVKNHGEAVEGEPDGSGNFRYDLHTLTKPELELCDILGNSVPYDAGNLPTFSSYKVVIPSNFTIMGQEALPVSAATLEPVDALKYVKEYCDAVPDTATYIISILSESPESKPSFRILDGYGDPVDFEVENQIVTITEQVGKDKLDMAVGFDPLEVAKMWSNFMTADLAGGTNGYYTILPYLINGSHRQAAARSWATGIDITFTSTHTLENPAFHTAEIGNFVIYSENCFSCDIKLGKTMHLTRTGTTVEDSIHSTFYFVKYDDTDNGVNDPHWAIADFRDIV